MMNAVVEDDVEVDIAPKGNSLFAEVDDRRLVVEEQLKNYQTRVKELKVLYEKKVGENNKLRMQNIHLMNMASSSGSREVTKLRKIGRQNVQIFWDFCISLMIFLYHFDRTFGSFTGKLQNLNTYAFETYRSGYASFSRIRMF